MISAAAPLFIATTGGPAGQRLNHDETKRLWPVNRIDENRGRAKKLYFFILFQLTEVSDAVIEQRFNPFFEIAKFLRLLHARGNHQPESSQLAYFRRDMHAFLGRHTPQKSGERTFGVSLAVAECVNKDIGSVMNNSINGNVPCFRRLAFGDRYDGYLLAYRTIYFTLS